MSKLTPKSPNQVHTKLIYVVFESIVRNIHLKVIYFIVIWVFEYGTKFQLWTITDTKNL